MKTPKARKLPSGSWFVQIMVDGKRVSVTRATEKEAIAEAMALKAGVKSVDIPVGKITVREAIDHYIELRAQSCSPSSIRGYRTIQRTRLQSIMDRTIDSLKDADFQRAINIDRVSGKTMKNSWALISSAVEKASGRKIDVVLPPVIKNEHEFLQPDEIKVFLDAIRGTNIEIAALLGLHSLRRSEIVNVTWNDIDLKKNIIKVRGSAVYDENQKLVRKETNKTSNSRRDVPIMIPRLAELLESAERDSEFVVTCYPNTIQRRVDKICESVGLPRLGSHGLRHSFASLAVHVGMPVDIAQKIGGWDDYKTMKDIYTHIAEKDINKYAGEMKKFFSGD